LRSDRRELAAVVAGGALGGATRTWLADIAPAHGGSWPWVTFGANLAGCFLLGYFVTRRPWTTIRTGRSS
jgi:fluoride exporter